MIICTGVGTLPNARGRIHADLTQSRKRKFKVLGATPPNPRCTMPVMGSCARPSHPVPIPLIVLVEESG